MKPIYWYFPFLILLTLIVACSSAGHAITPPSTLPNDKTLIPVSTALPAATKNPATQNSVLPTEDQTTSTIDANDWTKSPVIPQQISKKTIEIYLKGLALGNNPHAFMKVGDCAAFTSWFLVDFDNVKKYYLLGNHTELLDVLSYFKGSFERSSLAAANGFDTASALSPLWADPNQCLKGENPVQCEYRIWHPSFALILLGTNDNNRPEKFEGRMRQIIEYLISNGVVPILSTKADNMEGNNAFNQTLAKLSKEYDIPLWNFWLAVQPLPHQGLQPDKEHLTWAINDLGSPQAMKAAWPELNLTALQVLDALRIAVLNADGSG